jgi:hypothetical protein
MVLGFRGIMYPSWSLFRLPADVSCLLVEMKSMPVRRSDMLDERS